MILYDLITGINPSEYIKGCILLRNGVVIEPSQFKSKLNKGFTLSDVYGYMLRDNLAVRMSKSLTEMRYDKAVEYCGRQYTPPMDFECKCYLPEAQDLKELYNSIIPEDGQMRKDLIEAGILEMCKYRTTDLRKNYSWSQGIWSSSIKGFVMDKNRYHVRNGGTLGCTYGDDYGCKFKVIPFIKINDNIRSNNRRKSGI